MLIKYPWDIKEKEKPLEVIEEKPKVSVISYPWDKPQVTTEELPSPTGTTLTRLPSKYVTRSLSLEEEYERKTLETPGVSQRMRGIGEIPKEYPIEGITVELKEAQSKLNSLWWSELKTTEDKWKFLKHENWSEGLQEADLEVMRLSEQASKMGVNIKDWINYGVYSAFFATMAIGILPILSGLPKNILNNLAYRVEGKTVKGKELLKVLQRVTYPDPRAGFGAPSKFDRKIFDEFVKQGGLRGIGRNLKTGVTITEIEPRFAFGAKLYAGLPADEIVKSLIKTGKLTADIARELSLAKPELVSQVIQNLSVASPAIASKLAPELAKLIPEEVVKPPKVEIKPPIETKKFGYPPEKYKFTGEYSEQFQGYYKATRNKIIVYAPIYKNIEGRTIVDMEQTTKVEPKPPTPPTIPEVPIAKKVVEKPEEIPKVEPVMLDKPISYDKGNIRDWFVEPKNWENKQKLTYKEVANKILIDKDMELKKVEVPIDPSRPLGEVEIKYIAYLNDKKLREFPKEFGEYYELLKVKTKVLKIPKAGEVLPKELYRGGLPYTREKVSKEGMPLTESKKIAEDYVKAKKTVTPEKEAEITKISIEPNAKVLTFDNIPKNLYKTNPRNQHYVDNQQNLVDWAKEQGYDVIDMREFGLADQEIRVLNPDVIVQMPPGVKPEVVKVEPKPDLATPAQIKKAHAIADTKAMINEKGKVKPQYRKIAETFTGEKSIKDMTPEEAEMFIDQLSRLPEPKMKAGKLVPPTIPRTMKLVTEDFFKRKYGEPTPIWLLTDQTYYATKLGIKPLVEPFERGKQEFDLEFRLSSNLVDRMVNKLNTIAKTSVWARARSRVKNIPTKAESDMAGLLNKHEATPPGLTEKEEDVFKYFRNLSKDIWRRENEVREKVDLPPIKYKTAYFRHTADAMAKEMLEGKYPFPQGIKYWAEKMVGKKIFNPMEFQRKLSDDLIDIWSKDIRAVTKAMLWNGLKEIYLAQPAKFLNEQLNAITKDLPEYKNLTPRDQAAYDQTRAMPASTRKWLVDYVNQVLKGQETELDASLNRIVTKSGLKGIFDKVLSPFGRSIGRKPITNLFMLSGRAVISGVMGWVPRQIIRNAFQQVQNLALYGVKATAKSFLPASIDKNLKGLLNESLFLKSYTGFEELPVNLMGKLEKVWLKPYGIVAVNNAKQGMKAAYWDTLDLIRNPKYKKHGWSDPRRTKDTPKGFLYPKEEEYLSKEMEFGSSATQYQYIPIGMPGIFRYKVFVPLTRLQSWWMNYFTKFNREAIHRGLKGRPSWADEDGPTLPWSRRVNYLKYLIIGGAILTALGYRRSFMLGVAPVYLSPAGQVALGFYNYVTATEDWKREKALRQIYYSWKAFIPGSLAWRDFLAVWKGEKDLEEILFYGKKKEKPSKAIPTKPKYEWEKTETEKKSIIKYDWD